MSHVVDSTSKCRLVKTPKLTTSIRYCITAPLCCGERGITAAGCRQVAENKKVWVISKGENKQTLDRRVEDAWIATQIDR